MKPPKELVRMFVHTITVEKGPRKGQVNRLVFREATTNATRTTLGTLHALTRKGLITYDDAEEFLRVFGVHGWNVKLTEKGYALLEVPERAVEVST